MSALFFCVVNFYRLIKSLSRFDRERHPSKRNGGAFSRVRGMHHHHANAYQYRKTVGRRHFLFVYKMCGKGMYSFTIAKQFDEKIIRERKIVRKSRFGLNVFSFACTGAARD
jgi:hypothetical protein